MELPIFDVTVVLADGSVVEHHGVTVENVDDVRYVVTEADGHVVTYEKSAIYGFSQDKIIRL